MITVNLLLRILAFVCMCLATFGIYGKVNTMALGLALWILSTLIA